MSISLNSEQILKIFIFINLYCHFFINKIFKISTGKFDELLKFSDKNIFSNNLNKKIQQVWINCIDYLIQIYNNNKDVFKQDMYLKLKKLKNAILNGNEDEFNNNKIHNLIFYIIKFWHSNIHKNEIRNSIKHSSKINNNIILDENSELFLNSDGLTKNICSYLNESAAQPKEEFISKWLYCYSFFFSRKLLNRYFSKLSKQKKLLNLNIPISIINYKINLKWDEDNPVCINFKQNLLKELYSNKNNLSKIWGNIFKVFYFHCYTYNQEAKTDYVLIYSNMDKHHFFTLDDIFKNVKIYKHLQNNFICLLSKNIVIKNNITSNLLNYRINQKTILKFYLSTKKDIFNYNDFKEFIEKIISKSKKPKNDQKSPNKSKIFFYKRILGNYKKWGEKLFLVKNLKYFIEQDKINQDHNQKEKNKVYLWKNKINEYENDLFNKSKDINATMENILESIYQTITDENKKTIFKKQYFKNNSFQLKNNNINYWEFKEKLIKSEIFYRYNEIMNNKHSNNENELKSGSILKKDFMYFLNCIDIKVILKKFKEKYKIKEKYVKLFNLEKFNFNNFLSKVIEILSSKFFSKNKIDNNFSLPNIEADINNINADKQKYINIKINLVKKLISIFSKQDKKNEKYKDYFDTELSYYIYNKDNWDIENFLDSYLKLRLSLFNQEDEKYKKIADKLDHIGLNSKIDIKKTLVEIVWDYYNTKYNLNIFDNHEYQQKLDLKKC